MKTQTPEEITVDLGYDEPQIPGAIAAIYDSIAQARLRAGLPKIRVDDGDEERTYTIKNILEQKGLPKDSKIFFEFGFGDKYSLIYSKIKDDKLKMKTDNFLEDDEEMLNRVLPNIDLTRTVSEPYDIIPDNKEERPVEVSLASLFPEPEMTKRTTNYMQPNRFEVSLSSLPEPKETKPAQITVKKRRGNELVGEELKEYMRKILLKDRNTQFQQILVQYSADGHKLPPTPKANMRKKDEMCETYNQLRKTIKIDLTSNYGNKAPKVVKQKIPVAKPMAPTIKPPEVKAPKQERMDSKPPVSQIFPKITPEPAKIAPTIVPKAMPPAQNAQTKVTAPFKIEAKPKKKLAWDEQKVMNIVKSEYKQKHNFSQVLASISGYELSKANKNKVYVRFTELMGI